jgi:hypothetical protein
MADRFVMHVTPNANGWEVRQAGSTDTIALVDDKDRALELAREHAQANEPAQVVIHTRDGKIAEERTYGDDPRDIPG